LGGTRDENLFAGRPSPTGLVVSFWVQNLDLFLKSLLELRLKFRQSLDVLTVEELTAALFEHPLNAKLIKSLPSRGQGLVNLRDAFANRSRGSTWRDAPKIPGLPKPVRFRLV